MDEKELVVATVSSRFEVTSVIDQFREELDDYREAINENTNEIQANYEFISELNKKIDRLTERLDELTLLFKGKKEGTKFNVIPLSKKEKEIFQAIYELGEQNHVTYRQISRKLALPEQLIASYVTNIIEKGVLVLKKYVSGIVYLQLDHEFRQFQAKENIVRINTSLNYWMG